MYSFEDLLDRAMVHENSSYIYYGELSRRSSDKDLKNFFLKLALEELEHKRILQHFLRSRDIVEAVRVAKQEGAVMRDVDSDLDSYDSTFDIRQALFVAIKYEDSACDMYNGFASSAPDSVSLKLWEMLASMEKIHAEKLQKEFDSMSI